MNQKNEIIRQAISRKRLKCYEVAAALHIHRTTFSSMLCQSELSEEKTREILEVIEHMEV